MSRDLTGPADGFFDQVLAILREARGRAYRSVNQVMVDAYWKIGRRIVEEEQGGQAKAAYGDRLMEELTRRLGDELGKGFSVANLLNFRQFNLTFPDPEKLYALRRELGWISYGGGQPGKGFYLPKPKNLRLFCLSFPDPGKRYTLGSELGWSDCRLIMWAAAEQR